MAMIVEYSRKKVVRGFLGGMASRKNPKKWRYLSGKTGVKSAYFLLGNTFFCQSKLEYGYLHDGTSLLDIPCTMSESVVSGCSCKMSASLP
jgi:hypothetical protein